MCFICRLIHYRLNKEIETEIFRMSLRKTPHIVHRNEREKYYKKFTNMKIVDIDYIYGGLVDMLELSYGKKIDEMIKEEAGEDKI
jgi:hypothetical protein